MTHELTEPQKIVYDLIVNSNGRITQLDIARKAPSLGSHERHEGYLTLDSTLRKVRSIVRDLIMKHGVFILSDKKGYYIKKTEEEAEEFMKRFERQAKASAKSYMQRYHVMQRMYGFKSQYFEKQIDLFESVK